jgi:hypothetical protein
MTMHDLQIEHVFTQLFAPITLILVKRSGLKHNEAAGSDGARGKTQTFDFEPDPNSGKDYHRPRRALWE